MKTSYPPCLERGHRPYARQSVLLLLAGLLLAGCGSLPLVSRTPVPANTAEAVPASLAAGFERARTLAQGGDEVAAISELERLASAHPTYSGPLLNLGLLHLRADRLQPAREALLGAIARNANNAAAHNQLGILYRKTGEFEQAERAYMRALQIDAGYALAHLNLGVLYDLYLQRPQQALQAFRQYQALALQPEPQVADWINELQRRLASGAGP